MTHSGGKSHARTSLLSIDPLEEGKAVAEACGVEMKDHLTSPVLQRRCTHTKFPIGTNSTNVAAKAGQLDFEPMTGL
jgi:hypothetical protein